VPGAAINASNRRSIASGLSMTRRVRMPCGRAGADVEAARLVGFDRGLVDDRPASRSHSRNTGCPCAMRHGGQSTSVSEP
jgi:hypothetical protein